MSPHPPSLTRPPQLSVERRDFPVVYRDKDLIGVWTFGEGVRLGKALNEFDLRRLGRELLAPLSHPIAELFVRTRSGNIYRFEIEQEKFQIKVSNADSDIQYAVDTENPMALFSYTNAQGAASWIVRVGEQIGISETILTSPIEEIVAVSSFVVYAGKSFTALRQAVDRYTSRELNLVTSEYLRRRAAGVRRAF